TCSPNVQHTSLPPAASAALKEPQLFRAVLSWAASRTGSQPGECWWRSSALKVTNWQPGAYAMALNAFAERPAVFTRMATLSSFAWARVEDQRDPDSSVTKYRT